MKLASFLGLALSWQSAVVRACGGHGQELRHWSQEELDELERKWGIEVCAEVSG
jgi:agmatinase